MHRLVADPVSYTDYLALEESASVRHEYVGGYVYAMTGGTGRHNRIALNIVSRLLPALESTPCQVFAGDVKLRVESLDRTYYPDVFVACRLGKAGGETEFRDATLIVEVLSDSTAATDRREKRIAYQALPGLRAYWIVSQSERQVEVHLRGADGRWGWLTLAAADAELPMPELPGPPLKLAELYVGTDLA